MHFLWPGALRMRFWKLPKCILGPGKHDDSRSSSCSSGKSADPNSDQDSTDGEDQLLPERPEPWNVSDEDGEHLASLLLGS